MCYGSFVQLTQNKIAPLFPFSIPENLFLLLNSHTSSSAAAVAGPASSIMDPQFPAGGTSTTPKRQLQLQGPRPSPLKVSKDSHRIKKPPHPPHHAAAAAVPGPAVPPADQRRREPLIIYDISPKVIHAEESNFMSIVQRYTGLSSLNFSGDGDVSPAARLAVTEKASPSPREKIPDGGVEGEVGTEEGLLRKPPGILSPAPDTLIPLATGTFFSPAMHDWSPNPMYGSGFMPSPSTFLPGSLISSPTLSSDFFAPIWND